MKMILIIITIWSTLLYSGNMDFKRFIDPFPVYNKDGQLYKLPFGGGLNRPIIQFVDIDGDDDQDLFIEDNQQKRMVFFLNDGTPEMFVPEWQTDYYKGIDVGSWFKFVDVDNDNDYDLFAGNSAGMIRLYLNNGTITQASFYLATDTLKDSENQPVHIDGFTVPEWSDLDGDTFPDLYFGNIQDGSITFYQHSATFDKGVPIFKFITAAFQNLQIITASALNKSTFNYKNNRHGANALNFTDIDADGDNDLFWGDFFWSSLIFIPNSGTYDKPIYNADNMNYYYPSNNPVSSGGFNVSRFTDIDADGDQDLFIGVLGGYLSQSSGIIDNFFYYENTGIASQAIYILRSKQFIHMLDIGHNSIPALADIDGDQDLDLFIANEIDLDAPEQSSSRLWHFENKGSLDEPIFQLQNKHYLGKDGRSFFDANLSPAFVDIDADNDMDLFAGNWEGKILFYNNTGTSKQAEFVLSDENYAGIDVGSNSTPVFADIDADGDYDLFIGENSQNADFGRINFYKNNGTNKNAIFEEETNYYFNIDPGNDQFIKPFFVDMDNDNDLDLFIGTKDAGIVYFENSGSKEVAEFNPASAFQITTDIFRSTAGVYDIDNDGKFEIISGARGGGLYYYEQQVLSSLFRQSSTQSHSLWLNQNYPNPFNAISNFEFQILNFSQVDLSIYNLLGEKVATLIHEKKPAGSYKVEWDATSFASGIYVCKIKTDQGFVQTRKLVLLK